MRLAFALVALPLLAGGLAACGNGGKDTVAQELTPAAAVRQAVGNSTSESYRYRMEVTGAAAPGQFSGEGEYRSGPPVASHETFTFSDPESGQGSYESITVGSDQWMKTSGAMNFMPDLTEGKWVKGPSGSPTETLDVRPFDIREQVRLLFAASDLRKIGADTVDGASTTHYSGTATPDSVRATPDLDQATKDTLIDDLDDGTGPATVEAWVDDAQRIRRYVQAGTDSDGAYRVTVTFRDHGADVPIAPPPAQDTVDLDDPQLPDSMQFTPPPMSDEEKRAMCEMAKKMAASPPPEFGGQNPFAAMQEHCAGR